MPIDTAMNNSSMHFINLFHKFNLKKIDTLLLLGGFFVLFTCMYELGFVMRVSSATSQLFFIKDELNEIIFQDETLFTFTAQAINTQTEANKTDYNKLSEVHIKNLLHFFHRGLPEDLRALVPEIQKTSSNARRIETEIFSAIKSQNSTRIEKIKTEYEEARERNNQKLKDFKSALNEKINQEQLTIAQTIILTRVLIIINMFVFLLFFILQMRKMNSTFQQFLKIQNEKDEAQEHMTIVGELTAGINHEIKNILCVAGLHSSQLSTKLKRKAEITSDEVLKSVQKIETSVERAEKIIRSVSKLSYDSSHDDKKDCSVYEIFTETQEFAEYFAQKNEVDLRIESVTPRLKIHCHPIQISQVLLNLIKNSTEAIENLEEKWVTLKAEWKDELKLVVITVSDSGKGIPAQVREKLFQKQFSTKAPGKGTGLGLSISGKIIDEHNGEIYVDAQATNTTFVIKLPATMQAPPQGFVVDEAS